MDLNSKLQPMDAPVANRPYTPATTFENEYEVQSRRLHTTSLVAAQLVVNTGTVAIGTFGITTASYGSLTTDLTPLQVYKAQNNMGIPLTAIYEGTAAVGSMQVYPTVGAGITAGKFPIMSGFDYARWVALGTPALTPFVVTIQNTTGTTALFYAQTFWKYVQNNAGTSIA
jgi:hypothetical protein